MKMIEEMIYKVCDTKLWSDAEAAGEFKGAEIDITDGYIHFSTEKQLQSTLQKHFAGRTGLVLVAVDASALGDKIIYEEARGGVLFPHLYEPLVMSFVKWVKPLANDETGNHIIPELER